MTGRNKRNFSPGFRLEAAQLSAYMGCRRCSAVQYGMAIGAKTASPERRFSGEGYCLSPASIRNINEGESLVLPSPNGSAISFKVRDSGITVFSACFRNMSATAKACSDLKRVLVIPCGERWPDGSIRPSIEDYAATGGGCYLAALS